jgi:hypothetical protein
MKTTIAVLVNIFIGTFLLSTHAADAENVRSRAWLVAGGQYNEVQGGGVAGNVFDRGKGFIIELGWAESGAGCAFGTGAFWTVNRVLKDSVQVRFYTPLYFDFRLIKLMNGFSPFASIGVGWMRMYVEDCEGSDNQYLVSLGIGAQIGVQNGPILQILFKPYKIYKNSLGQDKGIELHVGIGLTGS